MWYDNLFLSINFHLVKLIFYSKSEEKRNNKNTKFEQLLKFSDWLLSMAKIRLRCFCLIMTKDTVTELFLQKYNQVRQKKIRTAHDLLITAPIERIFSELTLETIER